MSAPTLIRAVISAYCRGDSFERIGEAFDITRYRAERIVRTHAPGVIRPKGASAVLSYARKKAEAVTVTRRDPPPDVLTEAVKAYSAPRTITEWVAGDPLPGRSALDQKRAAGAL